MNNKDYLFYSLFTLLCCFAISTAVAEETRTQSVKQVKGSVPFNHPLL